MDLKNWIIFGIIFSVIRPLVDLLFYRLFPRRMETELQITEEEQVFRAYSRALLRDLSALKAALADKRYAEAESLLDNLIEDTKKGLTDGREEQK